LVRFDYNIVSWVGTRGSVEALGFLKVQNPYASFMLSKVVRGLLREPPDKIYRAFKGRKHES
jgi:hypothetical protein